MRNSRVENARGILLCDGRSNEDGRSDRESRARRRERRNKSERERTREEGLRLAGRESGDEIVCMRHSAQPDQFSGRYPKAIRGPTRGILQGSVSASYKLGLVSLLYTFGSRYSHGVRPQDRPWKT